MVEQEFCSECESVLDLDGTCWHCAYEQAKVTWSDRSDLYERTIRRLEQRNGDLEGQVRELEYDKRRLEDKLATKERELRDAQYRDSRRSW